MLKLRRLSRAIYIFVHFLFFFWVVVVFTFSRLFLCTRSKDTIFSFLVAAYYSSYFLLCQSLSLSRAFYLYCITQMFHPKHSKRTSLFRENALYHCYYLLLHFPPLPLLCIYLSLCFPLQRPTLLSLSIFPFAFHALFFLRIQLHTPRTHLSFAGCCCCCCRFIAVASVIYYHFLFSIQVVNLLEILNVFL